MSITIAKIQIICILAKQSYKKTINGVWRITDWRIPAVVGCQGNFPKNGLSGTCILEKYSAFFVNYLSKADAFSSPPSCDYCLFALRLLCICMAIGPDS